MDQRSRFRTGVRAQTGHHHSGVKETPAASRKKVKLPSDRRILWVLVLVLVVAVAALTYGYIHTKNQLESASSQTQNTGGTEAEQIINQVSKSVQLPAGQTPTIATVQDAGKLKDQVFFKDAQNGDKVLYYSKSGQAVLYRPASQKVILFAYVNLSESSSNPQQ
jgi:hypothetical protein